MKLTCSVHVNVYRTASPLLSITRRITSLHQSVPFSACTNRLFTADYTNWW